MSDLVHASREALSDGGALASHLDAFVPRPAQLHLTEAIADALQQRDLLLAEAGTGTGKTFAYLVPVLLSGCAPSSPPAPARCRTSSTTATAACARHSVSACAVRC